MMKHYGHYNGIICTRVSMILPSHLFPTPLFLPTSHLTINCSTAPWSTAESTGRPGGADAAAANVPCRPPSWLPLPLTAGGAAALAAETVALALASNCIRASRRRRQRSTEDEEKEDGLSGLPPVCSAVAG